MSDKDDILEHFKLERKPIESAFGQAAINMGESYVDMARKKSPHIRRSVCGP